MYRISEYEQGTENWRKDRMGKVTASVFSSVITSTGKLSASCDELINRAVAEKITGIPDETFESFDMIRGSEMEEEALDFFNFKESLDMKPCGFVTAVDENGDDKEYGCSPDAIDFNLKIGGEFKCPKAHTHLAYLAGKALPKKHIQQVQGGLCILGLDKWFFGSYHPDFPSFGIYVSRDEEYINKLKPLLDYCHEEITKKYKEIMLLKEGL